MQKKGSTHHISLSQTASSSLAHLKIMLDLLHRHFDLDDSHKILPGTKDGHREGNQYSEAAPDFRNGSACNVVSFSVDRKYQGLALGTVVLTFAHTLIWRGRSEGRG